MAEALLHAQTPPKFVRVYRDAKTRRAFVRTVWLKDVPGALAAAAGALASTGVNLVGSSSSTSNGTGYAEWGFFAEVDNKRLTRERTIPLPTTGCAPCSSLGQTEILPMKTRRSRCWPR